MAVFPKGPFKKLPFSTTLLFIYVKASCQEGKDGMAQEEIDKIRKEIDMVDEALTELLARRLKLAQAIGVVKGGKSVYDPVREKEILQRLQKRHPELPEEFLTTIMTEIISLCRSVQQPLRIAFMGPEGSYSEQAALIAFGKSVTSINRQDPREVFLSLQQKEADYGVVPVENTIEGVVYATLDAFAELGYGLSVIREIQLPIRHVLASQASSLEQIEAVHSHPQALAQCRLWLSSHLPHIPQVPVATTSLAASHATENPRIAAICSVLAAEKFRLPILVRNIQDQPHNTTRFWVIGRGPVSPSSSSKSKTSLLFNVSHTPGALIRALNPLEGAKLNLTFIQSRPLPDNPFEYVFFVDIEGHADEERLNKALEKMRPLCYRLRVLGSYPY